MCENDFDHVMTPVVKIINRICSKAKQHRMVKMLLDKLYAEYTFYSTQKSDGSVGDVFCSFFSHFTSGGRRIAANFYTCTVESILLGCICFNLDILAIRCVICSDESIIRTTLLGEQDEVTIVILSHGDAQICVIK